MQLLNGGRVYLALCGTSRLFFLLLVLVPLPEFFNVLSAALLEPLLVFLLLVALLQLCLLHLALLIVLAHLDPIMPKERDSEGQEIHAPYGVEASLDDQTGSLPLFGALC